MAFLWFYGVFPAMCLIFLFLNLFPCEHFLFLTDHLRRIYSVRILLLISSSVKNILNLMCMLTFHLSSRLPARNQKRKLNSPLHPLVDTTAASRITCVSILLSHSSSIVFVCLVFSARGEVFQTHVDCLHPGQHKP